ncbi:hypothetical protein EMCRGX_G014233 [Ephydatia muelleri]
MASEVLKSNLNKLARVLDPTPIATQLYSDSLITQEILDALGKAVQINERAFDRFLEHLRGEKTYLPYVEELEAQLAQAREGKPKTADVVSGARRPLIRDDAVDDVTLLSIARDVGPKWEEMGIILGADFRALRNELCRQRHAEAFTYKKIAAALEEVGLKCYARKHCFTN